MNLAMERCRGMSSETPAATALLLRLATDTAMSTKPSKSALPVSESWSPPCVQFASQLARPGPTSFG